MPASKGQSGIGRSDDRVRAARDPEHRIAAPTPTRTATPTQEPELSASDQRLITRFAIIDGRCGAVTALSERPASGSLFCEYGENEVLFLDYPTYADLVDRPTSYRDDYGAIDQTWTDSTGVERGR